MSCFFFIIRFSFPFFSIFEEKSKDKKNDTTEVEKNVIEEVIALELLCPFPLPLVLDTIFLCHTSLMMAVFLDMKIMFYFFLFFLFLDCAC